MNRIEALRLTCPKCGAPPHMPCMGKRGPRTAHHSERYTDKRDIGYRVSKGIREARCNKPGWVYLITAAGTDAVKIGFTASHPDKRLRSLQTSTHHDLRLLAFVAGTRRDEERYHAMFAHLHIRGEWFKADREIMEYFGEMVG